MCHLIAQMEAIPEILKVTGVSVTGLLAVFAWGFVKEWWVPGKVHNRERTRGDKWEQRAWESHSTAGKAITVARQSLDLARKEE